MKILGIEFEEKGPEHYKYETEEFFIDLKVISIDYNDLWIRGFLRIMNTNITIEHNHILATDYDGCLAIILNKFILEKSKIDSFAKSLPEETYTLLNVKDILE